MKRFAEALKSWAPRGDAEHAATAAECAKRAGCSNGIEMAEMMLEEIGRIERDGIVARPGHSPPPKKIKLSLKGLSPSTSSPPTAPENSDAAKPKKLKLKIGNLASLLKDDSDSDIDNDEKKSASGDNGFRITLSQSSASTGKRKLGMAADLDTKARKIDPGDDEWVPGMAGDVTYFTASNEKPGRPKTKPKLKLSSYSSSTSSSVHRAGASMVKPKAPSRASPKPKGKAKGMSARARLNKKMKF